MPDETNQGGQQPAEPKVKVDEDWKAAVEAERAQAAAQGTGPAAEPAGGETAAEPPGEGSAPGDQQPERGAAETRQQSPELPPASLSGLVSMLFTQALAAMGMLPDPGSGKPEVQLPLARHMIDMLQVVEEKTKGNLTSAEAAMLENVLHQLRLTFVDVQKTQSRPG